MRFAEAFSSVSIHIVSFVIWEGITYGAMVTHLLRSALTQVAETDLRNSKQYCSQTSSLDFGASVEEHIEKAFPPSHQLKLIDLKCRLSDSWDEQIAATSCLIFFGPLTRTQW
ncbi:hypothetical protein RHGRI_008550 [Rhododendron griersonianum]|uniref:Uncharacterized protein n=1 Tax=Rhododendron griersonianum TaxID=479676 RepID=A0AAV6L333_9ERIC|nr:hypothetical protein RHGRI_008550 [Rhododendron griersonianum]